MKILEKLNSEEQDVVLETLLEQEKKIGELDMGCHAMADIIIIQQKKIENLQSAQFYNTVSIAMLSVSVLLLVWIG